MTAALVSMFVMALAHTGCAKSHQYESDGAVTDSGGPRDQGAHGEVGIAPDDVGTPRDADVGRDAGPTPTVPLVSGDGVLVDAFVTEAGILVVLRDRVMLMSRAGVELERWPAPREVMSAAFDGTYLGIADAAALTTLTTQLAELGTVFLTEPCVSAVVLGQHRFVCGPSNDWDRIFYTYDLVTSTLLASSEEYTYNGIPMRAVPGRDAFITVTVDSSPSDFHYHTLAPSGAATFINESPYHGDFQVSDVYAFDSSSATRVVTHEGLLLRMDPCDPWPSSTCLTRDGAVGTLRTGERYVGLDTGADDYLYALVGRDNTWGSVPPCERGCTAQRIDVSTRTVTGSTAWTIAMDQLVALRHDPETGGIVAAGHSRCELGNDCTGWRVFSVAFE